MAGTHNNTLPSWDNLTIPAYCTGSELAIPAVSAHAFFQNVSDLACRQRRGLAGLPETDVREAGLLTHTP